mmetsp:Transcript_15681/g.24043  ORF Transcript_15681/g.24043 Transcript_15681/m.24043 type:complete len:526 (+) Transcript_15681:401-1978(+)
MLLLSCGIEGEHLWEGEGLFEQDGDLFESELALDKADHLRILEGLLQQLLVGLLLSLRIEAHLEDFSELAEHLMEDARLHLKFTCHLPHTSQELFAPLLEYCLGMQGSSQVRKHFQLGERLSFLLELEKEFSYRKLGDLVGMLHLKALFIFQNQVEHLAVRQLVAGTSVGQTGQNGGFEFFQTALGSGHDLLERHGSFEVFLSNCLLLLLLQNIELLLFSEVLADESCISVFKGEEEIDLLLVDLEEVSREERAEVRLNQVSDLTNVRFTSEGVTNSLCHSFVSWKVDRLLSRRCLLNFKAFRSFSFRLRRGLICSSSNLRSSSWGCRLADPELVHEAGEKHVFVDISNLLLNDDYFFNSFFSIQEIAELLLLGSFIDLASVVNLLDDGVVVFLLIKSSKVTEAVIILLRSSSWINFSWARSIEIPKAIVFWLRLTCLFEPSKISKAVVFLSLCLGGRTSCCSHPVVTGWLSLFLFKVTAEVSKAVIGLLFIPRRCRSTGCHLGSHRGHPVFRRNDWLLFFLAFI